MGSLRLSSLPKSWSVRSESAYALVFPGESTDSPMCRRPVWRLAMSYVVAVPEFVVSAASDLSDIGSGLSAAHAAAAVPTTAVVAAAGDEVSAAIASLFSGHAQAFQSLSAQAAAFHSPFVQAL